METEYAIIDRWGDRYRVHSDRDYGWSFRIWHDQHPIGYMNCIQQRPVLLVGDFRLRDDMVIPESLPDSLVRRFLGRPRPTRSYRNRGLGTAMFVLVSGLAKTAGFERLEGWISDVDTEKNPELPDWYKRRGFTVTLTPSPKSRQVATIRKDL